MVLYEFPKGALFDKVLPKSKVYEHTNPSGRIKNYFVSQVDKIVWQYKLSPETCNMQSTSAVAEIQVFAITLKGEELAWDVLRCIDQAVPSPLVFELHREKEVQVVAAYKRKSESDRTKWVISDYFASIWFPATTPRNLLPLGLTLEGLYAYLLQQLFPYPPRQGENLQAHVERIQTVQSLQIELQRYEAQLRREKQFNLRIPLHTRCEALKKQIISLQGA